MEIAAQNKSNMYSTYNSSFFGKWKNLNIFPVMGLSFCSLLFLQPRAQHHPIP
jgi:hypothetical protein